MECSHEDPRRFAVRPCPRVEPRKVGAKVTIDYRMTAAAVDVKAGAEAKPKK
jgi:hypothetical protein